MFHAFSSQTRVEKYLRRMKNLPGKLESRGRSQIMRKVSF